MNLTKFGSPHLDTPSSRYDFCKFAFKYVKINKNKLNPKCYVHPIYYTLRR